MRRVILTFLVLLPLVGGCADFGPTIENTSGGDGIGTTVGTDDTGMDETGGMDDTGDTGDTGTTDDTGDTGDTGDDTGTTGDTGEPMENPKPGEFCDPFLAFNGDAPCDGDPENPSDEYTCVPVRTEPVPDQPQWDFRCVMAMDDQDDGYDEGDPCEYPGQNIYAGCMNTSCTSNGLVSDPDTDPYVNHPPGACPFDQDGALVKGCCTPFCDGDNPCDAGWQCQMDAISLETGIGHCIWEG